MPGLGDTTAFLKQMRRFAPSAGGPAQPLNRCVEQTAFGGNPGALRLLHYVPADLPKGAPLVVTLHGCTQQGEAYADCAGWLDLADRLGFAVLAPEQVQANNPNRCFNWFTPEDTARGSGEAASIAAMIGWMIREHGLDSSRVYVTGLSAGGAMTAVMLAAYPELFAGGAIIAGLPYGAAQGLPDALRIMQGGDGRASPALADLVRRAAPDAGRPIRLTIWHGDADKTVHPANGRDLARQWTAAAGLEGAGKVSRHDLCSRRAWTGESVVELVTIPGLGHGTPLSTLGDDSLGTTAPYMIETGLCSTRQIAAFWGLTAAMDRKPAPPRPKAAVKPQPEARPAPALPPEPQGVAARVMEGVGRHVPGQVQDVIARALRSAGLMK